MFITVLNLQKNCTDNIENSEKSTCPVVVTIDIRGFMSSMFVTFFLLLLLAFLFLPFLVLIGYFI